MTNDEAHLSQIATRWSLLLQAHRANDSHRGAAQTELLLRYCGPVYRYLRSLARDEVDAEDLCQDFALRFLRGDFRHADPKRGRFRDYLKASLCHLAQEFRRRKLPRALAAGQPASAELAAPPDQEANRAFADLCRQELLNRTWDALAKTSAARNDRFFEVLRLKAQVPSRTAADLVEALSATADRPLTPDGIRQALHRARLRFAELLRIEAAASLPSDDPEAIDAELADLGLLVYCQPTA